MVVFAPMSPTTFIQTPHGLACDGCGVAKDDLCAIETMEKQERGIHELFHNAARIHTAMRGNRWLIPIFRKYRKACREILQQKKKEADQLAMLSEYCDQREGGGAHPHQPNHDLKCIQSEMREIHNQIKSLEEMKWTDDDSDSSSCSSCSSDCSDSEDEHGETQGETREECNGSSESEDSEDSEDSSSDSEDSDDSGLSDVMEFLRQSLIE